MEPQGQNNHQKSLYPLFRQETETKNTKRFRLEEKKRIQIPNNLSSRQKAQILRNISIYLFGAKRFKEIELSSNLKSFHTALQLANSIYSRVDGLAMVIFFQKVPYLQFEDENAKGVPKQYSIMVIKLTRNPTKKDEEEAGFHPGKSKEEIEEPITQIIKNEEKRKNLKKKQRDFRPKEGRRFQERDRRQYKENKFNKDHESRKPAEKQEYREKYPEQKPRKYRQLKHQRVSQAEERRGQRKTRGIGKLTGQRIEHDYDPKHLNRDVKVKRQNRYDE